MRSFPCLLIAALVALVPAAQAAPVDDVLASYVQARGGAEAWRAARTLEASGVYTSFSKEGAFTLWKQRPNAYRLDYHENGKPSVAGYDGTAAWWQNGMMLDWITEPPKAEREGIRGDAEFDGPLFDPQARGHRVELVGRETLEGQPALKLKLTRADGVIEHWYLDPRTYLEVARQGPGSDFGQPVEQWTWFSDFRTVEGGLVLPHRIESDYATRHRAMQIERVRVNGEMDGARFRMPAPEGIEPLLPLIGSWRVKVESRSDPSAPWTESETSSTIGSPLRGLLQEHLIYDDAGDRNEVVRTWSYDRFRQRYRVTLFDAFTTYQNVLEGQLEAQQLVVTNVETKTAWVGFGVPAIHARLVASAMTPESFKLDSDLSFDGGQTWQTFTRFTYTKAQP